MLAAEPDWPHGCEQLENVINEVRREFSQQKDLEADFEHDPSKQPAVTEEQREGTACLDI